MMSNLISRADALEAIKLLPVELDAETVQRCIEAVSNLPSAQPVRHGKWIFGSTLGHSWMKCSECCVSQDGQTLCFSYCPNCGAKMDGGEE